jgi:hypothetical protein
VDPDFIKVAAWALLGNAKNTTHRTTARITQPYG